MRPVVLITKKSDRSDFIMHFEIEENTIFKNFKFSFFKRSS